MATVFVDSARPSEVSECFSDKRLGFRVYDELLARVEGGLVERIDHLNVEILINAL